MFDFHEKRKIRGILYSKTVFVLLILLAILLSISVYNRFIVAQDTRVKLNERKEDLKELEMRAETLQAKVEYLENERGIEEELRNRFDVAKEGEQVVIILEDEEESEIDIQADPPQEKLNNTSSFSSFINLLKFW